MKHVKLIEVNDTDQKNILSLQSKISTNFLITIDERIRIVKDNITKLMEKVKEVPNKVVTYHGISVWQNQTDKTVKATLLSPNYPKAALLHFAAFHKDHLLSYKTFPTALRTIADTVTHCNVITFNFDFIDKTLTEFEVVGNESLPSFVNLQHYTTCFNKVRRYCE